MRIKVISRRGSTSGRQMREALGDYRIGQCQGAVNFGLQGDSLQEYERRYPAITRLPIMNHRQVGNKYDHIILAQRAGVNVPNSRTSSDEHPLEDGWIIKPYYSARGQGIRRWNGGEDFLPTTHYFQREITNRRYEMRVHCWSWVDPQRWIFQKRIHEGGDEVLTWNHEQGGTFVTINEPFDPLHDRIRADVQTLMNTFGYRFGAVDFIIQTPGESGATIPHYFIEWNLCPGWTLDHINDAYIRHFNALTRLTQNQFRHVIDEPREDLSTRPVFRRVEESPREELAQQPRRSVGEDDLARYQDALAESLDVNFCPQCGRAVNTDIFGALPRFCPGCGQRCRM